MTDVSDNTFTDPRSGKDEGLESQIKQVLSKGYRIKHLFDILNGERKDLSYYYKNKNSFNDGDRWASLLASSYPEKTVEFINREDAEFTYHNLKKNAVVDFLAQRGISRILFEEVDPTWLELLLFVYHALYDSDAGEVPEYGLLLAHARLFKHHSNHQYQYADLNLEDLSDRVDAFVRSFNRANSRPLSIYCYSVGDKEFVLDLYQERSRNAQAVFDIRMEDEEADRLNPKIRYESRYIIKSISANIIQKEDSCEIKYSKTTDGWDRLLNEFFETVFNVSEPLSKEQRKRTDSVETVLDSAFEVLEDDEATDEDIIESVNEPLDELSESASSSEVVEDLDINADELEETFNSIELVGVQVRGVEEALTETFEVNSMSTLRDWTDMNVTSDDSLKRVVSEADRESIGFVFRGDLRSEDDTPEEFILQNGMWKAGPGRVSEEATEVLNLLFQNHDE